jgi:hypothetical protein
MDKLAALRQKHPGKAFARLKTQGREFYLAAPSRTDWHAFLDAFGDQRRSRVAMENLATKCVVDPSPEEVSALFEKKPGLAVKLSEAIGKLAGVDDEAEIELFPEP